MVRLQIIVIDPIHNRVYPSIDTESFEIMASLQNLQNIGNNISIVACTGISLVLFFFVTQINI